jgi:predicted ester cyclase
MPFHHNLDRAKSTHFKQLLTGAFQDFPQFLKEITRIVPEAGLRPISSTHFSIYYSLSILLFDAMRNRKTLAPFSDKNQWAVN